jgi:hypothetical protein
LDRDSYNDAWLDRVFGKCGIFLSLSARLWELDALETLWERVEAWDGDYIARGTIFKSFKFYWE